MHEYYVQILPRYFTVYLVTRVFKFGVKMLKTVVAFRELQEVHNLEKSLSES